MLRSGCIVIVVSILFLWGLQPDQAEAAISKAGSLLPVITIGQSLSVDGPSGFVLFIGRFHPVLVHLPIGFLLLAFLLECFARIERFTELEGAVPFALLLGSISAIGTSVTGYLLSLDGGYGEELLATHMWLGIAVAVLSLTAFLLRINFFHKPVLKKAYAGILGAMLFCLVGAGHYGGSLTHGSDYLIRYMPQPLRLVAGLSPRQEIGIKKIANIDSALIFADVIYPILNTRCVSCHNPEKKKGGLLLTTYQELMRGGESGPLLEPGSIENSDLVHRLLLPESDEDHMPPEGKVQLTNDQVELIVWWVQQDAPEDKMVSELEVPKDISVALAKLTEEETPFLIKTEVPEADTTVFKKLDRQKGIQVSKIAHNSNFLQVKFTALADSISLKLLEPLAQQVTWLELSNTEIDDNDLSMLSKFNNLTRLNLEQTNIADSTLKIISSLENLEYLNVYATDISDKGLLYLAENKSLRSLYVWQTKVSEQARQNLYERLPQLYIDTGWKEK